jgi:succinate dehydrogenase/fumarate reductase flavoprotein subunit
MTDPAFDCEVDVLVVGSGGGGLTAALKAKADGLDTLVVEKSPQFGGSTALSGGGIWVPGAPSQRRAGYEPSAEDVFTYLRTITDGLVSDARLRQYVDAAPEMMDFLERSSVPVVPSAAAPSTCRRSICASSVTKNAIC